MFVGDKNPQNHPMDITSASVLHAGYKYTLFLEIEPTFLRLFQISHFLQDFYLKFFSPLKCFSGLLFLPFFFLLLSAFFVFGLITYDWSVQTHLLLLLWLLLLLQERVGACGCVWVCSGAGSSGCTWMCVGIHVYAQGCAVWTGVCKCAQVCVKVHWCLQVCVWDEFSEISTGE